MVLEVDPDDMEEVHGRLYKLFCSSEIKFHYWHCISHRVLIKLRTINTYNADLHHLSGLRFCECNLSQTADQVSVRPVVRPTSSCAV
jgi:hypothetical protein